MPDTIGGITVPEITPSGTFPIKPDRGYGMAFGPEVVVHQFGSGNAKIEQRFYVGTGAKRFLVRRSAMNETDRAALAAFWEAKLGPYGAFTYNAPLDGGSGTAAFTCRFANEPLSWEFLANHLSTIGVTLIEIPTTSPTYTLNATQSRFPSGGLPAALLPQEQEIIPLLKITAKQAAYPVMYLSDRRCTVGAQLYQARLLSFDGIRQSLGAASDNAQFTFGNADRVMRDLANDVDLFRAAVEFSLFHVGTGIKLDLWKGEISDWGMDAGPEFHVTAAEGIYELNLPYPVRTVSRHCWKTFNDGNACPFATEGALDLVHFPTADGAVCDKGYDTANGCLAHGMKLRFGGILAEPQNVRIRNTETGNRITSTSLVSDSIYGRALPEIYTDAEMPVNCLIAAGREESDFYIALGIVGEGPLGAYGGGPTLDGQPHHGQLDNPPNNLGLRMSLGTDPASTAVAGPIGPDYFSLNQKTPPPIEPWRIVFAGASYYKENFAAGTPFVEVRRKDPKGIQLSRLSDHEMVAFVNQGLFGWVWTAAGVRSHQVLTNPIWIVVNALLRARGLRFADAATAELFFDVDAAIAAAAIADTSVTKLLPTGTADIETQFKFRGVLYDQKPLRDWIEEILMNCLGYYSFAAGKLKLGIRVNSSVVEAFTDGNVLFQSLQLAPLRPSFNQLTANFANDDPGTDGEPGFKFAKDSLVLYDPDHAALIGGATSPLYLSSEMNLAGTSGRSQVARLLITSLREELGGAFAADWKKARRISFKTTVLALNTEPGMVCSLTNSDMPGGAGEFRVTGWRLNHDYSIDIEGRTTTDNMYDYAIGPKPADVLPDPVPTEPGDTVPKIELWGPVGDMAGNLFISFQIPPEASYLEVAMRTLYDDLTLRQYFGGETLVGYSLLDGALTDVATFVTVNDGQWFRVGAYATVAREIIKIVGPGVEGEAPTSNTMEVARAQCGTVAAAADDNATIRPLYERTYRWHYEPGYTLTHPNFTQGEVLRPGQLMILYAELIATDHRGRTSEPAPLTFAEFGEGPQPNDPIPGMLPGFLCLKGDIRTITVPGFLRLGKDLSEPLTIPLDTAIGWIYVAMRLGPQGADAIGKVQVDGIQLQDSLFGPTVDVEAVIPAVAGAEASGTGVFYAGEFLGNVGGRELVFEWTQTGNNTQRGEDTVIIVVM